MGILEKMRLALTSVGKLKTGDDGEKYLKVKVASGGTAFMVDEQVKETTEGINPNGKLTNYMRIDGDCGTVPYVAKLDKEDKHTPYVDKVSEEEYHNAIRKRADRMKETQDRAKSA